MAKADSHGTGTHRAFLKQRMEWGQAFLRIIPHVLFIVWGWLTQPPVEGQRPEDQRRIRMLNTYLLFDVAVSIGVLLVFRDAADIVLSSVYIEIIFASLIYAFTRSRYYRTGLRIFIALWVIHYVILIYPAGLINLLFAVSAFLFVTLFLPVRWAAIYGIGVIACGLFVVSDVAGLASARFNMITAENATIFAALSLVTILFTTVVHEGDLRQIQSQTASVRESEARLRALIDSIPDNIYFKDTAGRFVLVNRATWTNDGFVNERAMLGKTDMELYADLGLTSESPLVEQEQALLTTGKPIINYEFKIPDRSLDDERSWVLITKVPIYDSDGEMLGLVGINRDISALKRFEEALMFSKEEAEAANRAKSIFLANMSHELLTPLNVILGMSDWMAADDDLRDDVRDNLATVHRSGKQLLQIIHEILQIARNEGIMPMMQSLPETGEGDSPTFISEFVPEAIDFSMPITTISKRILVIDGHPDSRTLLQSILTEFGFEVRIAVNGTQGVDLARQWRPDLMLLDVRMPNIDGVEAVQYIRERLGVTAPPIIAVTTELPQEQWHVVPPWGFEGVVVKPFQVSALVDAVMRVLRHETDVVANRTPLNGAGGHQPPRSSSSIEVTGSQQAQVLVVDDQRENVRLLMNVLRQEGYVVRSAYDGHAALQSAQAMPPDLILLDVRMPEMDGYELCERIKSIPRLRSIPVIFISVADGTLDKVRAFALGAVDYITKPFELAELRMRIASHLAIHRLAASEERQRIARELHDAVSQTLFSAKIVAESLPVLLEKDTNAVRAGLVDLIRLTQAASAEMRSLLMELRPNTLTHTDLNILLTYLVNGAGGRTTASINLQTKGQEPILPFNVKINLYRIAQEALNNIIKHAQAKHVTLILTCDRESPDTSPNSALLVVLQVRDDGCGFLPDRVTDEHMGLRIMRERAAEANISLEIKTAVNQGTIVEAAWGAISQ